MQPQNDGIFDQLRSDLRLARHDSRRTRSLLALLRPLEGEILAAYAEGLSYGRIAAVLHERLAPAYGYSCDQLKRAIGALCRLAKDRSQQASGPPKVPTAHPRRLTQATPSPASSAQRSVDETTRSDLNIQYAQTPVEELA